MTVLKEKATELAVAHVRTLDLKGFRYEHVSTSINAILTNEWNVVFDVYSPSGNLMDGPVVLVVERDTGLVRSLMSM